MILCCHSRITRQPFLRSSAKFRLSRSRFFLILFRQNLVKVFSQAGKRYPCQKSPSINTAIFASAKTISGLPGSVLTFLRNLRPRRRSSEPTSFSRSVPFVPIRDMQYLRCAAVRLSAIDSLFRSKLDNIKLPCSPERSQVAFRRQCMSAGEFRWQSITYHRRSRVLTFPKRDVVIYRQAL